MGTIVVINDPSSGGGGSVSHNSTTGKQGIGPEYYHLNLAEYTAVTTGITPNNKYGEASLAPGSTNVSISFGTAFTGAVDYIVQLSFRNETDLTPNVLAGIVTARTLSGFTARLAGEVDSSNYVMMWRAFR